MSFDAHVRAVASPGEDTTEHGKIGKLLRVPVWSSDLEPGAIARDLKQLNKTTSEAFHAAGLLSDYVVENFARMAIAMQTTSILVPPRKPKALISPSSCWRNSQEKPKIESLVWRRKHTTDMFRAFAERTPGACPCSPTCRSLARRTAAEFEAMGYALVIGPVSSHRVARQGRGRVLRVNCTRPQHAQTRRSDVDARQSSMPRSDYTTTRALIR